MTKTFISCFQIMGLQFVRRPVSEPPEDGAYVIADDGVGGGWTDRQPAKFENGEWLPLRGKKLRFAPVYWSEMDGDFHGRK